MKPINTDIIVIGGGSGGLSVAAGAAQMGANVVLFEDGKMGGDCLNTGCVPSKALIAAGKAAHYSTGNPEMGITGGVVEQEAAIALSNLAIWNPKKKTKDKIAYSTDKDGRKIRLFKSDGVEIK